MENSYEFVVYDIIPATQLAFKEKKGTIDTFVRVSESKKLTEFKKSISEEIKHATLPACFPTSNQVFVAIIQFYTSLKNNYSKRDVDNLAKTVLDVLQQNNFYKDDSQVRTLLVSKRVDLSAVKQDLGFVYIKVLEDGEDMEIIDETLQKAMNLYNAPRTPRTLNIEVAN